MTALSAVLMLIEYRMKPNIGWARPHGKFETTGNHGTITGTGLWSRPCDCNTNIHGNDQFGPEPTAPEYLNKLTLSPLFVWDAV